MRKNTACGERRYQKKELCLPNAADMKASLAEIGSEWAQSTSIQNSLLSLKGMKLHDDADDDNNKPFIDRRQSFYCYLWCKNIATYAIQVYTIQFKI